MELEAAACFIDERRIRFGFDDVVTADDGLEIEGEVEVFKDGVGTGRGCIGDDGFGYACELF